MQRQWLNWLGLLALTLLFAWLAARFPYFPGDVGLARFIQSVSGHHLDWARFITRTVSAPWIYVLLLIVALAAWRLIGWRGAIIAVLSYGGVWFAEATLKSMVARPRPSAQLIQVAGSTAGFSFPSGFGLFYFSLFGLLAILALRGGHQPVRLLVAGLCILLLLIGGAARVALGAHWPSDILGAFLISATWIGLLLLANQQFSGKT